MHITILLTLSIPPGEAKLPVYVQLNAYYTLGHQGWTKRLNFTEEMALEMPPKLNHKAEARWKGTDANLLCLVDNVCQKWKPW